MLSIVINTLLAIHVLVSLLIILLVLMQRPKNEGLGAAFGGGMTENLFGAQTTNVLQTVTRWLGGIFFALTLTLSWLYVKQTSSGSRSSVQQRLLAPTAVPSAPTAPKSDAGLPKAAESAAPTPATPLEVPEAERPPTALPAPAPPGPAPTGESPVKPEVPAAAK